MGDLSAPGNRRSGDGQRARTAIWVTTASAAATAFGLFGLDGGLLCALGRFAGACRRSSRRRSGSRGFDHFGFRFVGNLFLECLTLLVRGLFFLFAIVGRGFLSVIFFLSRL